MTISWHTETNAPIVFITVSLAGQVIKIGTLDPLSQITPIALSFKGVSDPGIHEVLTHGTLLLDLIKREVTYDMVIDSKFVWTYKGVLFSY